ncbi:MAG TPA: RNA-binding protein [Tepidisphaeraceae bacterium]|nr:RNA-binding protein [Tepidisphaeraceae bacterium]
MSQTLQVKGLSNIVLDADLVQLFRQHGTVVCARVIPSPSTGLGSGSGHVEMSSPAEARAASSALDGAEYLGRTLKVTGEVGE